MNVLDHTLPEVAQNYLAILAGLSARLADKNEQFETRQTQVAGLQQHVEKLESRLAAAEQALKALETKHDMALISHPKAIEKPAGKNSATTTAQPANPRLAQYGYVDNGNETITDTKSGLMWKQRRESGEYKWDDAIRLFNNPSRKIEFAGFSDWRLPTVDELKTLILKGQRPSIFEEAFPDSDSSFWSSSPGVGDSDFSWAVDFGDGGAYGFGWYVSWPVRLVRATTAQASKQVDAPALSLGSIRRSSVGDAVGDVLSSLFSKDPHFASKPASPRR